MENYSVSGSFSQPYRTYSCLWERLETDNICQQMDDLESQLRTTALAKKMLEDIGVKF
jgi:hypothetical protein